jgi:hypothetical protein
LLLGLRIHGDSVVGLTGPGETVDIVAIIASCNADALDIVNQRCQGQVERDQERQLVLGAHKYFLLVIVSDL